MRVMAIRENKSPLKFVPIRYVDFAEHGLLNTSAICEIHTYGISQLEKMEPLVDYRVLAKKTSTSFLYIFP